MRLLLTGSNGTVGTRVRETAADRGWEVARWDRSTASPDDPAAISAHVSQVAPDAVLHLAMGAPSWAAQLGTTAAQAGIPYVFTSTASVFAPPGPHRIADERTATDDYGRYKIECEDAVRSASDQAVVVRLGYQIDLAAGGNNMGAHLRDQAAAGPVPASSGWTPATSMLSDTVTALLDLLERPRPGLHHLDANAEEAWRYPQIVRAVAVALGAQWSIAESSDRVDDQRLLESLPIAPLSTRLPLRA